MRNFIVEACADSVEAAQAADRDVLANLLELYLCERQPATPHQTASD